MRAAVFRKFGEKPSIEKVEDPAPAPSGAVIEVKATGICRSDWHGWMGHDPDIVLPHVPGHELAGIITAVGRETRNVRLGDRVTLPFVCGCGTCPQCLSGNQQVCDRQFQPGFTHWGSFAEFVAVDYADLNLVALPDSLSFLAAASLGCRFVTSFRAIVDRGRLKPGEWLAVHGAGGVGLSAIMIGRALGALVVAVDLSEEKLALARKMGAHATVNAKDAGDVVEAVRDITAGGAHVSIDALGSQATCCNSIACLRKRGRHVQVGLMLADQSRPPIPMAKVIANELEIYGSHGIQAHRYPELLAMIEAGALRPEDLIGKKVNLEEGIEALVDMDSFKALGVTVIDRIA
jgi:alcohol dehydrogenase